MTQTNATQATEMAPEFMTADLLEAFKTLR